MCGIFALITSKSSNNLVPRLINGLQALEYRGYDSAGIAFRDNSSQLRLLKAKGKVSELGNKVESLGALDLNMGIAHTRWATHGEPSEANAHPHVSTNGKVVIVHNGIVENYRSLKADLVSKGFVFQSETDTEILVNLLEDSLMKLESEQDKGSDRSIFEQAIINALEKVAGTYGLVIIFQGDPDNLYVVRKSSPIVIGLGHEEYIVASDYSAIIQYTKNVAYLEENTIGIISAKNGIRVLDVSTGDDNLSLKQEKLVLDGFSAGKEGYDHYMLKEISEQPEAIRNTMRGRLGETSIRLGGVLDLLPRLSASKRIYIAASGTSRLAGLVGQIYLEEIAGLDVVVEYSSEFSHLFPKLGYNDTVIGVSQSGETADTLTALRGAKAKQSLILGITNVVGSSLSRETDGGVYIHVGPEISVASTKAFSGQVTVLLMLALFVKQQRLLQEGNQLDEASKNLITQMNSLPVLVDKVLKETDSIVQKIAEKIRTAKSVLFFAKGVNYPIALEGALKLKELTYIHAEGMSSGELKHGTIAMIDESVPCIFIATRYGNDDDNYAKVISNIQEVKARGGRIFIIATEGDKQVLDLAEDVIFVPEVDKYISPLTNIVPLQLLAYYTAVKNGKNVDQPRNLAKSVTVG